MPKQKKAKSKKVDSKRFRRIFYVSAFFISFIVLLSLSLGGIFLSAYWENIRANFSHTNWFYTVGLPEDEYYRQENISDTYLYVDNVLYLNMTDIATMCDMTVVGDFSSLTYFCINDSTQTATFYFDSDKLTVNGEHYKMNGAMFTVPAKDPEKPDIVYVPASFVARFCTGVIVEINEDKHTVHLYRHSLAMEYDPLDRPYHIYEDVVFLTGSIQPVAMPDRGLMFSSQNNNVVDER